MLCTRCIVVTELADANYCPRCGRKLKTLRTHTLSVGQLRAFESRLAEFLPRLQAIRRLMEQEPQPSSARHNLISRRLALAIKAEKRLIGHLHDVRQQLTASGKEGWRR